MDDIIVAQSTLLRNFGFICPSAAESTSRPWGQRLLTLRKYLARLLLFCTSVLCIMEIMAGVAYSINSNLDPGGFFYRDDPLIIRIFNELQFCLFPVRAVMVLTIFLLKQSEWQELHTNLRNFVRDPGVFYQDNHAKVIRKLRLISWVLFAVTLALHCMFFCFQRYISSINHSPSNLGVNFDHYCYLFVCFNIIENTIVWVLTIFPAFFLSQQVLLTSAIFSTALLQALRLLEEDILQEITNTRLLLIGTGKKNWTLTFGEKVRLWTTTYKTAQQLLDQMNRVFSWILVASVTSDISTALGLGTELIQPKGQILDIVAGYSVVSCALFIAYATLFFLPFALLHDKVPFTSFERYFLLFFLFGTR